MEQLILHLIGDYVTQSDWMAQRKTKESWPAFCHAAMYSAPFIFLIDRPTAGGILSVWFAIFATHFLIDRYRLARFVVYAKNKVLGGMENTDEQLAEWRWSNCRETGYPSQRPAWLAVWLLIAADNTLHLAINYAALRWL